MNCSRNMRGRFLFIAISDVFTDFDKKACELDEYWNMPPLEQVLQLKHLRVLTSHASKTIWLCIPVSPQQPNNQ